MRKILVALMAAALVFAMSASIVSAEPGKPVTPPDLKKVVLIHYAQPDNSPGRPFDVPPGKQKDKDEEKQNDAYALLGPTWGLPEGGITYVIDTDGAPSGAVAAISSAFETWDDETSANLFNYSGIDDEAAPSLDYPDFENVVCWRGIAPPSIIAVTVYWYWDKDGSGDPSLGDEMVDADIIFNALLKWSIEPNKKAYHVQNIATHEAGHVVGLDDLYDEVYSELTMYGYSKKGETKKVDLQEGDVLGTHELYGE